MNPKKAKALRRAVREILKQPNGKEMLAPEGLAKAGRRAVRVVTGEKATYATYPPFRVLSQTPPPTGTEVDEQDLATVRGGGP